ncbi:MAG: ABC transporter ATP-binding protein [Erysipelotrichaceae bacterium]|nr:ABC transporter ATP-binding protein [Erysipelotrichaceae bacterium]
MPDVVLECNHIWKKIGHHVIVNDLSLKLYPGDILGFIGPNGAGKTTSIKLMLGLQFFNGGNVKIGGYDLKKNFVSAISNVGAIIENPDLYMYMSGYDNLKMAALMYQVSEQRIQEVIQLVGLEQRIHDKIKKYSLGMRQRLGIAQAILHQPRVLILDEPMNGLDPEGIKELKDLLIHLAREEHMAILISSHILSELESFCNRVCIISKGKIIKDTKIENIKKITNQMNYILELSDVHLENILYHYEVLDQCHIKIYTTKEQVGNILKALLLNDIKIFEMKREVISLEDAFLEVTKENELE